MEDTERFEHHQSAQDAFIYSDIPSTKPTTYIFIVRDPLSRAPTKALPSSEKKIATL